MDTHFHGAGRYDINIRGKFGTEEVLEKLDLIISKIEKMANEQLVKLEQEVAENTTVIGSAIVLLKGLKQRLDEAGTDKAKLAELSASLDSQSNALAAAIAENTPAENQPPAEPPVTP